MLLLASIAIAYHSSNALLIERERSGQLEKQLAELTENFQKTRALLEQEKKKNESVVAVENTALQNLRASLEAQKLRVEAARLALEDAKASLRNKGLGNLSDSIEKEKSIVDSLQKKLQGIQNGEVQVGKESQLTKQQKKSQEAQDLAQVNSQISFQQTQISSSTGAINALRGNRDANSKQQMQSYKDQLAEQRNVLAQLQAQRVNVQQYWNAQIDDTQSDSNQSEGSLKQTETQTKKALLLERGRLQQLQQQMGMLNKDSQSLQNTITKLNTNFETEKAKLETLQQELNTQGVKLK